MCIYIKYIVLIVLFFMCDVPTVFYQIFEKSSYIGVFLHIFHRPEKHC